MSLCPGGLRRPGACKIYMMLRVFAIACAVLPAGAASLRKRHKHVAAGQHQASGSSPAAKLERLLADVEESVRKGGQDAELVFAQLYSYDSKLESSLEREVGMLNSTQARLQSLQDSFRSKSAKSEKELEKLTAALTQSRNTEDHYQESSQQAREKFDSRLVQVKSLMEDFRAAAAVGPAAAAVAGQVSQKKLESLRGILAAHGELHSRFADVFSALAVGQNATVSPSTELLNAALSQRIVSALQDVSAHLHRRKTGLLLQLQAREHKLSKVVSTAAEKSTMAAGARAEGERKAEELAFSLSFTASVLQEDETFLARVQDHMKAKGELVDQIRNARKGQLQTLEDLVDLLKGKFTAPVGEGSAAADSAQPAADKAEDEGDSEAAEIEASEVPLAVSFLQKASSESKEDSPVLAASALQTEVETAIRYKKSTHNILLRIQAELDHATPIDSTSVKDVVMKMGTALRAVEGEDVSADDAKRRCKEQNFHAEEDDQRLKASLQLMAVSRNHTTAAIVAAKKNLAGIESKSVVLNKTTSEFNDIANQAGKTLDVQKRDRRMIMAAISKAQEVASRTAGKAAPAAGALLSQLLALLKTQDGSQREYQKRQESLEADLHGYTSGYEQLLTERKLHYERTLSALELYTSELASDAASRSNALKDDAELKSEGTDLCNSILAFYKKHGARREKLGKALKAVLPKMPDILMKDNVAADAEAEIKDEDDS